MSEEKQNYEKILKLAVRTGELMLKCGAETYRVEDTISRMLNHHNFYDVDTFVVPTGIMVTIEEQNFNLTTKISRIKARSNRLDKIEALNQLSRDYVADKITIDEAYSRLKQIDQMKGYSPTSVIIIIGISCGFFSIMFGGGFLEFIVSILIGIPVGLLQYRLGLKKITNFFILFVCAAFLGLLVMIFETLNPKILIEPITIGCIMPLLPGLSFTNAVRDAISDELLSGISRGLEAILSAVALAAGIGISFSFIYLIRRYFL